MVSKNLYLLWFANENIEFRLPEIESILKIFNIDMKWIDEPSEKPFWVVEFESQEDALKLASRSITLRSVIKLWGAGDTIEELHKNLKNYPQEVIESCLNSDVSFRVEVVTFGKTFTMKEKVDKIEAFNYLPAKGSVKLDSPDVSVFYIEYYGHHSNAIQYPEKASSFYFGIWLADGQRALISKYSLKTRKFIGNTSMDPQLSLIMANQALVKKGDIIMDPFVGSGSLLVAAAQFGGYVLGVDIDFLTLHGKSRPTRVQDKSRAEDESIYNNMKQYETESQYLDVLIGDSSLCLWHDRLKLDSIITDPPYGIREPTERIGTTREYKISEQHLEGHIPSKVNYGLTQIFTDLLNFSVKHLKVNGRLVSWIPVLKNTYNKSNLPSHPCMHLVSNSEQSLNDYASRRLLTWEKIREVERVDDVPKVPELFPSGFRQVFFARGETRKERKMRIAEELKEKGITYSPKNRGKKFNGGLLLKPIRNIKL